MPGVCVQHQGAGASLVRLLRLPEVERGRYRLLAGIQEQESRLAMQPAGSGVRPVGRNGHMIFPNRSAIEWTNATWNPVTGCTRVSAGCDHCYAARMTYRLERMRNDRYTGLTVLNNKEDRHFSGVVRCHEDLLDQPLHWRNPRRIFLCSMSDLFHPKVPFDFIDLVFAVMARCQQHTFQVLTKQPERMAEYCNYLESHEHSVAEQWVDAAETLYFNGHDWSIENAQDLHDLGCRQRFVGREQNRLDDRLGRNIRTGLCRGGIGKGIGDVGHGRQSRETGSQCRSPATLGLRKGFVKSPGAIGRRSPRDAVQSPVSDRSQGASMWRRR